MNIRSVKNNAFVRARSELKNIFAQRNTSSLYGVFIRLIATRCSVDEHQVNQEFIYNFLKKSGMQQQELEQWNQFYNQLSELKFFNKHITQGEYQILQHYADRWIDRLEKIL
jgi:nitrate reductase beta subunit